MLKSTTTLSHWEDDILQSITKLSRPFNHFCNGGLSRVKNIVGSKTVVNCTVIHKIGLCSNSMITMPKTTDLLSLQKLLLSFALTLSFFINYFKSCVTPNPISTFLTESRFSSLDRLIFFNQVSCSFGFLNDRRFWNKWE